MKISRHYICVDGQLVHYRRAGHGPPVVMLHASPMSSATMASLMRNLSDRFTCYAFDTPGYGLSDALPENPLDLVPYVNWLARTLAALKLDRVLLYGQATGAQIGIEFARTYPQMVAVLVMDSAAVFRPEEVRGWLPRYLPPLRRKPDGSHLISAWTMVRDMTQFFPWMLRDPEHRLARPAPNANQLHASMLDLLRAGAGYRIAYAAAFRNETPGVFDGLTVPIVVILWDESVIRSYSERILSFAGSCQVVRVSGDVQAKSDAIRRTLETAASNLPYAPHAEADPRPLPRGVLCTQLGAIHYRTFGPRYGSPLVYFHKPLSSSALVADEVRRLMRKHLVIVPDLAGHGETDVDADHSPSDFDEQQWPVAEALLDWIGGRRTVVSAATESNGIAVLAARRRRNTTFVRLPGDAGPEITPAREPEPGVLLDIAPRLDGSHLVAAWGYIRDSELYRPWNFRSPSHARSTFNLSAQNLHARTVELLKVRGSFAVPFDGFRVSTIHQS